MRRLVLFLVLAAGCLSPVDSSVAPVTERSGAVGEPTNGFPSAFERLGLMAINRARSDPATVKGPQSTIYPARPPVIWSLALNQSARFHATTLEIGDVTLMHSSPCTLKTDVGTSGCSGDPSLCLRHGNPLVLRDVRAGGGREQLRDGLEHARWLLHLGRRHQHHRRGGGRGLQGPDGHRRRLDGRGGRLRRPPHQPDRPGDHLEHDGLWPRHRHQGVLLPVRRLGLGQHQGGEPSPRCRPRR